LAELLSKNLRKLFKLKTTKSKGGEKMPLSIDFWEWLRRLLG